MVYYHVTVHSFNHMTYPCDLLMYFVWYKTFPSRDQQLFLQYVIRPQVLDKFGRRQFFSN